MTKETPLKSQVQLSLVQHIQRREMSIKDYLPSLYSYYQGFGNLMKKKKLSSELCC